MMSTITVFKDNCMIIRIRPESIDIRGSLYKAVCRCWRVSIQKAEKAKYVLAIVGRSPEVKGVFEPDRWYYQKEELCRKIEKSECKGKYKVNTDRCHISKRIAFEGKEITSDANYLHKLIPEKYFPLQNPVRFTY